MKGYRRDSFLDNIINIDANKQEAKQHYDAFKMASDFSDDENKVIALSDNISGRFLKSAFDLNAEIIKIATNEKLSEDMINLVVRATNNKIYGGLYTKTAGQKNREVIFDIADPAKIIAQVFGQKKENAKDEKVASSGEGSFAKVAGEKRSLEDVIAGISADPVFKDYSAPVPGADEDFYVRKMASLIEDTANGITKIATRLMDSRAMLGDVFVEYAGYPTVDHQKVFDLMVEKSAMPVSSQAFIKLAFDAHKSNNSIARGKDLALHPLNGNDFSLGRHSIHKIAEEVVATLPEVVDKKKDVRSFQRLVNIALAIQNDEKLLNDMNQKLDQQKAAIVNAGN